MKGEEQSQRPIDTLSDALHSLSLEHKDSQNEEAKAPRVLPSSLHLSASLMASYHHFECEKYLFKRLLPIDEPDSQSHANSYNLNRGNQFEAHVKAGLMPNLKDCTGRYDDPVAILRSADVGTVIYQMRLEVPDSFYNDALKARRVIFRAFIPDFIIIKGDKDAKLLYLVDTKASAKAHASHQIQVSFYSLLLEHILEQRKVRGMKVAEKAAIWLPGENSDIPQTFEFSLPFFKPIAKDFLYRKLPDEIFSTMKSTNEGNVNNDYYWHVQRKCISCPYVNDCRKEALSEKRNLSIVPDLSHVNRRRLESALPACPTSTVTDIEDLANYKGEMREEVARILKIGRNGSPYVTVLKTQKPLLVGAPTLKLPATSDGALYISLQTKLPEDSVSDVTFEKTPIIVGWSLCLTSSQNAMIVEEVSSFKSESQAHDQSRIRMDFACQLHEMLLHISKHTPGLRISIYVGSSQEFALVQRILLMVVSELETFPSESRQAMFALINLYEDSSSLLQKEGFFPADAGEMMKGRDIKFSKPYNYKTNRVLTPSRAGFTGYPRVLIVEQLIKELVALPVAGYYTIQDAYTHLVLSTDTCTIFSDKDHQSLENMYNRDAIASNEDEQSAVVHVLPAIVNAIVAMYHRDATRNGLNIKELLITESPPPFTLTQELNMNHQLLAGIAFVTQYEALKQCQRIRDDRISNRFAFMNASNEQQSINSTKRSVRLRYDSIVSEKGKDLTVRFIADVPTEDSAVDALTSWLTPDSGTFKTWILTADSTDGRLQSARFCDMRHCPRSDFLEDAQNMTVAIVDVVQVAINDQNVAVEVSGASYLLNRVQVFEGFVYLEPRYSNLTLVPYLQHLATIDRYASPLFLQLLQDPSSWSFANSTAIDQHQFSPQEAATRLLHASNQKLRTRYKEMESGKTIFQDILSKPLKIVWGPPGSGKTHFISLAILRYIESMHLSVIDAPKRYLWQAQCRPLIIIITAFTRAAIDNFLERIVLLKGQLQQLDTPVELKDSFNALRLVRIASSSGKPPSANNEIISKEIQDLKKVCDNVYKQGGRTGGIPIVIVGSTIWQLRKLLSTWKELFNESSGADLVAVDEGSQLPVGEGSIPLSVVNPTAGRLIIAGDHLQMEPIFKTSLPHFHYRDRMGNAHKVNLTGSILEALVYDVNNPGNTGWGGLVESSLSDSKNTKSAGPWVAKLIDNWRMNRDLNEFHKLWYGPDFRPVFPSKKLELDVSSLQPRKYGKHGDSWKKVLNPEKPLTLVRVSMTPRSKVTQKTSVLYEAQLVASIVHAYVDTTNGTPSLFIVTPHHQQRRAVLHELEVVKVSKFVYTSQIQVDTVEKMQGREADCVICCFGILNEEQLLSELGFLYNWKRWNVSVSRARCKVIVVASNLILQPTTIGSEGLSSAVEEGWGYIKRFEELADCIDIII